MHSFVRIIICLAASAVLSTAPALAGINYIEYRERYGNDPRGDPIGSKKAYPRPKPDSDREPSGIDSRPSPENPPKTKKSLEEGAPRDSLPMTR